MDQGDGLSSRVHDVEPESLLLEQMTERFLIRRKLRRVIALELDPETGPGDPDPEIGRARSCLASGMSRMPTKRVLMEQAIIGKLLLFLALEPVSLWLRVVV